MNMSRLDFVTVKSIFGSPVTNHNNKTEHNITTFFRSFSLYLILCPVLALMSGTATANQILFDIDPGTLTAGALNGQDIAGPGSTITVTPGEVISGTIDFRFFSSHITNPTVQVGLNTTWGTSRDENVRLLVGQIDYNNGSPTNLTIDFSNFEGGGGNLVAPLTNGLYYIVFAIRGECNVDSLMSATNWAASGSTVCSDTNAPPVWNDGNDLGWDWTQDQFDYVEANGQLWQQIYYPSTGTYDPATLTVSPISSSTTSTQTGALYGANWIAVQVVPVPPALWLFASGLLGVTGIARLKTNQNNNA